MKDKIIDRIIHELIPLRTLYKEIDTITNDLLINKLDSLETFLETNFNDINYSQSLKDLISILVQEKKLSNKYLDILNLSNNYFSLIDYKALNVKNNNLETIKSNLKKGINNSNISILDNNNEEINDNKEIEFTPINDFEFDSQENNQELNNKEIELTPINDFEFDNQENDQDTDDEILTLDDNNNIQKLRKLILNTQLDYLNNATSFIEELESKNEIELYQKLLSLNDIRYIQHSISKLSTDTLQRLLNYVNTLLEENNHNSINIFIEEAIKKNLHKKEEKKM